MAGQNREKLSERETECVCVCVENYEIKQMQKLDNVFKVKTGKMAKRKRQKESEIYAHNTLSLSSLFSLTPFPSF